MCSFSKPKIPAQQVAMPDNAEALEAADIEARLRKKRAGAAANILTSPTGIPAARQMGGAAA